MTSNQKLRSAREEFRHLLEQATKEAQWQSFFSEHPYILSRSLPLKLAPADIVPLGRPGRTEPDFVFYPKAIRPVPYYGVVELKRPDTQIISVPRSGTAILTRDAETAIQQIRAYTQTPANYLPHDLGNASLFLGNTLHGFIIMGMRTELILKLGSHIRRSLIEERLPANLNIIPFDTLLSWFEETLPQTIHLLTPEVSEPKAPSSEILHRIRIEWERFVDASWGALAHGGYPIVNRRGAVGFLARYFPTRYRNNIHELDKRIFIEPTDFTHEELEDLERVIRKARKNSSSPSVGTDPGG